MADLTRLTVYGVPGAGKTTLLDAVRAAFPGGVEPVEAAGEPDREQWMVAAGREALRAWLSEAGHDATDQGRGLAVHLPGPVMGEVE